MSDMPAVLLDCDGVIVDNIKFEQRVTQIIIDNYAHFAELKPEQAKKRWNDDLVATKGHPRWYDYAFHCERLGMDGEEVSRLAHLESADLLTFVDGFQETYHLLQEYGIEVGVVSDATSWVVKFKLATLDLQTIPFIFGSNDALATKASTLYWKKLTSRFEYLAPRALVDNREINLEAARSLLPEIGLIQFKMDEHVMTLPPKVAPKSHATYKHAVEVIHSHAELRQWLVHNLS